MLTYSASSRTSILRRQRRTIRVLAIPSPPQRGLHLDVLCPDSTAGTGYFLEPSDALWPDQGSPTGCGVAHTSPPSRAVGRAISTGQLGPRRRRPGTAH